MMNQAVFTTLVKLGCRVFSVSNSNIPQTEAEYDSITGENKPTWEAFQAELPNQILRHKTGLLRIYRNMLLAKCDWVMTHDNATTLANYADWVAYRQSLRDLPDSGIEVILTPNHMEIDVVATAFPEPPPVVRNI